MPLVSSQFLLTAGVVCVSDSFWADVKKKFFVVSFLYGLVRVT